jgi:hypothetical protein
MVVHIRGMMMKCFGSAGHIACSVLVVVAVVLIQVLGMGTSQAAFNITKDTFSISNEPGYCFAMAAFSRWYYLNRQGAPCLRTVLKPKDQLRIARELQRFYSKNLIALQADYCNKHHADLRVSFRRFLMGLSLGEPRLVLLMNKSLRGAVLHAVLAYEWVPERNLVKIYDPNYPGKTRSINLRKKEYTSLDITYQEICFPEVLSRHRGLVRKMEILHNRHARLKTLPRVRPVSFVPR